MDEKHEDLVKKLGRLFLEFFITLPVEEKIDLIEMLIKEGHVHDIGKTNFSEPPIEEFISEVEAILDAIKNDLEKLQENFDETVTVSDSLKNLYRAYHSIYEISGLFGFDDLARLSQVAKKYIDCLRSERLEVGDLIEVSSCYYHIHTNIRSKDKTKIGKLDNVDDLIEQLEKRI